MTVASDAWLIAADNRTVRFRLWSSAQNRLDLIDQMRRDAAFKLPDGRVPAGQAYVHQLLANCYDLVVQLNVRGG